MQLWKILSDEIGDKLCAEEARDQEDALIRSLRFGERKDLCKGHVTDINLSKHQNKHQSVKQVD